MKKKMPVHTGWIFWGNVIPCTVNVVVRRTAV